MERLSYEERQNIIKMLKEDYPKRTEVELVYMNDDFRDMSPGLKGKVTGVDDIGTIHVNWENGSTLGVVYGEDRIKKA